MSPRAARRSADLFTALVAASIGIALAGLTWRIAGDPGARVSGALVEQPRRQRAVDVDRLIALAPFGAAGPVAQAPSDATLQLRGILLAVPRSASAALISVGGAAPAPFYIGQQVGGGTIESFELDRVLLRTGNGLVALAFPDKSGASQTSGSPAGATGRGDVAAIRALIPPASRGTSDNAGATSSSPSAAPPPRADLGATLGAVPVTGGYRVGVALPPALRAAGVQPGDVIQRVNGVAVGDATRDAQLFATVSAAGSAQLDLLRNGQPVSISVSLR